MTSAAIAARGDSKKVAASGVEKEDGRKRKPKKKTLFLAGEGKQNVSSGVRGVGLVSVARARAQILPSAVVAA